MSVSRWLPGLLLLLAGPLPAAVAAPKGSGGNLPPQLEAQFHTVFDKADGNGDTFLDKDELARAFRGTNAKAPEQGMYDDKGRLTAVYYQAPKRYPELVFLWSADKDSDGRVSIAEFLEVKRTAYNALQKQARANQNALQVARRQAARSLPRRAGGRRAGRPANNLLRNLQRYQAAQQRQAVQAVQQWQHNYAQMVQQWQRNYAAAVRNQLQAQQRWANYVRGRMAALYRMPQRHFYAHVRRR